MVGVQPGAVLPNIYMNSYGSQVGEKKMKASTRSTQTATRSSKGTPTGNTESSREWGGGPPPMFLSSEMEGMGDSLFGGSVRTLKS